MTDDLKDDLRMYLQRGRDVMLWKLDGLGEYDIRRPLTPTGTNLLGLVKHLTFVELGYFGDCFGRPMAGAPTWLSDESEDPNADMWAKPDESREEITGRYRKAWAHADRTIEELALTDTAQVPWWPEGKNVVTLHRLLSHVAVETHRHAGHADIVRELIDNTTGFRPGSDNLGEPDSTKWPEYVERLEQAAKQAAGN